MTSNKITKALEDICNLGCSRVSEIIMHLEHGKAINETGDLDKHEINILLHELKTIMAVYQKPVTKKSDK